MNLGINNNFGAMTTVGIKNKGQVKQTSTNPMMTRAQAKPASTDGVSFTSSVPKFAPIAGMGDKAMAALNAYAAQDATLAGPGPGGVKAGLASFIEATTHQEFSMANGAEIDQAVA